MRVLGVVVVHLDGVCLCSGACMDHTRKLQCHAAGCKGMQLFSPHRAALALSASAGIQQLQGLTVQQVPHVGRMSRTWQAVYGGSGGEMQSHCCVTDIDAFHKSVDAGTCLLSRQRQCLFCHCVLFSFSTPIS